MQKLLICLPCIASLLLVACSSGEERENAPTSSFLERIPIVYRPDIQQGNIVTQEMVNQLRPGMSKRQVRFLMGTPMLVDVFHGDRWDYVYNMTEGWGETERKRLSLYFQDDQLVRTEGDFRPDPADSGATVVGKEAVVTVPDNKGTSQGIIKRAVESVSSAWEGDTSYPVQTPSEEEDAGPEEQQDQGGSPFSDQL
jgi:outer membrane protein assembly factor BamE